MKFYYNYPVFITLANKQQIAELRPYSEIYQVFHIFTKRAYSLSNNEKKKSIVHTKNKLPLRNPLKVLGSYMKIVLMSAQIYVLQNKNYLAYIHCILMLMLSPKTVTM